MYPHTLVQQPQEEGVGFRCVEQDGINTTTIDGQRMASVLGGVAQFETQLPATCRYHAHEKPGRLGRTDPPTSTLVGGAFCGWRRA